MIQIGNQTIPDLLVGASGDFWNWLNEHLIPAGEQFAAEAGDNMTFNGRPVTEMEMFAVRMATDYSPAAIAARWMADFDAFIEDRDDE